MTKPAGITVGVIVLIAAALVLLYLFGVFDGGMAGGMSY